MANSDSDERLRTDHLLGALGQRAARGGLVMIGGHGLKFAFGILGTAIMARLLLPEDYGLIGMVAVATNFVSLFKDLGLSFATIQRAEIKFEQISALFWINVAVSVVIAAGMAALAPGVAWFYGEPRLTLVAMVLGLGFIIGGLSVQHEALLRRQMRFLALSAIALISLITGYVVGITLALYGLGYWALVYSQLSLLAANTLGVMVACRWRPGVPGFTAETKSMLKFGGNITAYAIVNYVSKNSDNLLIGRFWGAQQLGFYTKAAQLAALPADQLNEPLGAVAIPALSRLVHDDERYRQAYLRMLEKVMLLTFTIIGWVIVTSDWVVIVVLGAQWTPASRVLVFIALGSLLQPVLNTVGWLFISQGRSRGMLNWSLINAPVSLLSIVAGLPWGATGVAAAYCFTRLLLVTPVSYWLVGRTGPVRSGHLWRCTLPFLLATTAAMLAGLGLRTLIPLRSPIVGLIVEAAAVVTTTLFVLLLMPSGRYALMDLGRAWLLLGPSRLRTAMRQ